MPTEQTKPKAPDTEQLEASPSRSLDAEGRIKEPQQEGTVRFNPQFATVRILSRHDWPEDAKPEEGSADFIWDVSNGWELPSSMFTDRQKQILRADGMFTVVD